MDINLSLDDIIKKNKFQHKHENVCEPILKPTSLMESELKNQRFSGNSYNNNKNNVSKKRIYTVDNRIIGVSRSNSKTNLNQKQLVNKVSHIVNNIETKKATVDNNPISDTKRRGLGEMVLRNFKNKKLQASRKIKMNNDMLQVDIQGLSDYVDFSDMPPLEDIVE